MRAFFIFLSLISVCAHARKPDGDRLEWLISLLMEQSSLQVLTAGEKPFTFDYLIDTEDLSADSVAWKVWLDEGFNSGQLTNRDVEYFLDDTKILFVSRRAVSKLLNNDSANNVLSKNGIQVPTTVDEWIRLRLSASMLFASNDPEKMMQGDIILGLSAGYPPIEVEAWSQEMK